MSKQNEMIEDFITDIPDENSLKEIESSDSDNQEQNDQSLSESPRPYKPLNDLGNAERFVEQNGYRVRYCPELRLP